MFNHPSWRKRPFHTALRLMACKVRQRIPKLHLANIAYDEGRARMVVDVTTAFGYTMYRYGHRDPDTDLVRALLSPGDLFIDGGAHVGLVALVAAAKVGPSGRVIAFEPAPVARKQLAANLAASGFDWVEVRDSALSDRAGECAFTAFGPEAWGSSSFEPPNEVAGGQCISVRTTTLDDALDGASLDRLRLIKLDLEGAECAALRGMSRILSKFLPDLLLELEPEHLARQGASVSDVEAILTPLGYRYFHTKESSIGGIRLVEMPSLQGDRPTANVFASVNPKMDKVVKG